MYRQHLSQTTVAKSTTKSQSLEFSLYTAVLRCWFKFKKEHWTCFNCASVYRNAIFRTMSKVFSQADTQFLLVFHLLVEDVCLCGRAL